MLIPINFDGEQPTVSARDLHTGLGIKSNFTTWFDRMCEYGFTELDYQKCFPNLESGCNGGQNMVDYEISVDMAKQIWKISASDKNSLLRRSCFSFKISDFILGFLRWLLPSTIAVS